MQKLPFASYEEFINGFKPEVPSEFNFAFDVLDGTASENPGRKAMIHIDHEGNRRDLDIAFFSCKSKQLAASFALLGLRKGDCVGLMLHRRVDFWVAALALHRIGAIAVPLPAKMTVKDLEYRIGTARIRAMIAEDTLVDHVNAVQRSCRCLEFMIQAGPNLLASGWHSLEVLQAQGRNAKPVERAAGGRDPLYIFFSSGTSGAPKMVVHDHTYPLGHATTAMYWHDLRPGDIHFTVADTGWAKSAWGKFYGQWLAGAIVFVYDFRNRFNAHHTLEMMSKHKVTSFCAPPTVYRLLIQQDLGRFDLSALRHCTSAGELLNRDIFDVWKKATGLSLHEGYGQTETTLQIATLPFMQVKPGSMGKPCPGWEVVLLDENEKPVPVGEEGEICLRIGDRLPLGFFRGYLNDPELTDKTIRNGLYHTGDKARMDEDGYYWFIGRNDDLIKSSGYRIGPFEVESALATHPAVLESAVTAMPDVVRNQIVKATVVLKHGYEASEQLVHDLQSHVKSITAAYKCPRVIEFVSELPKTISGKIRRTEIRARDIERLGV